LVIHYYSGNDNYWRRLATFKLNEGERKKFLEKWHFLRMGSNLRRKSSSQRGLVCFKGGASRPRDVHSASY
jgi:hypothetical protein